LGLRWGPPRVPCLDGPKKTKNRFSPGQKVPEKKPTRIFGAQVPAEFLSLRGRVTDWKQKQAGVFVKQAGGKLSGGGDGESSLGHFSRRGAGGPVPGRAGPFRDTFDTKNLFQEGFPPNLEGQIRKKESFGTGEGGGQRRQAQREFL